jgi:hypothetical protein
VQLLYDQRKPNRPRASFEELANLLRSLAAAYSKVFVVVDALDECQTTNGCRQKFLTEIFNLVDQSETRFFATSRDIPGITERFTGTTKLEIRASPNDVRRYVESQTFRLPSFVARNPELQVQVATGIIRAVDGMYVPGSLCTWSDAC